MTVPSDLTPDQMNALIERYHSGETAKKLAQEYGLNKLTLRDYFNKHDITKNSGTVTIASSVVLADLPADLQDFVTDPVIKVQVQHDQQIARLRAELRTVNKKYSAVIDQGNLTSFLIEAMKDSIVALPELSSVPITVPKNMDHGQHTCVTLLSDLHVGEKVDPEVMAGFGDYDIDIFRQRLGRWLRKLLMLVEIERRSRAVPRLVIFCDGDFISGLIHEELDKTNLLNVMDQMTLAAFALSWAIQQLAPHFESIHISCTVGNHGRNTKKVEYKDPHLSWDYLCYQHMAQWCSKLSNVTWDIPKSLWTITRVEQMDFLHMHGHGKTVNSLGIPYYGIDRMIKDFRELYSIHNEDFDGFCIGHYHHFMERDLGRGPFFMNPCWKGGDEFATLGLRKWSQPAQVMFLVHEKLGYVGSQLIYLKDQTPEDAEGVPERAPTIFADGNFEELPMIYPEEHGQVAS